MYVKTGPRVRSDPHPRTRLRPQPRSGGGRRRLFDPVSTAPRLLLEHGSSSLPIRSARGSGSGGRDAPAGTVPSRTQATTTAGGYNGLSGVTACRYRSIVDEIDDAALERALTAACAEASGTDDGGIVSVASSLRQAAAADDDPLRALIAGLEYHFVLDSERRFPHGPFGPMIEANGQAYPAPIDRVDELVPGTYDLWARAIPLTHLGLVRARFADLLWEARFGARPHEFAQIAIDSYTAATSEHFGGPVEVSEAIQRAVELASQIDDPIRCSAAIDAGVRLTGEAIESSDRMPGVALPLLAMFVGDRCERRPPDLDQLLQRAIERFGDDPWNLESALELQERLVPPEERDALRTRAAEAFRDLAHRSEGLVKYAHFQHAIELAEGHGLGQLADSIRREVEAITEDELDLKAVSAEVAIPTEHVEGFIAWFVGDDNLESALTRFGAHLPSGDTEDNRAFVETLMADYPLQFLLTRIQIGPENSLLRSTSGADDQAEQALIDHEAQRASMFSTFAVDILDEIRARYGPVSSAREWFQTQLVPPPVADKVVRAVELYEAGDFHSAASVLAPKLERVIRRIAGSVGLTVTRSPNRRGRSGGVKGLGELLGLLAGALPEPTRRYLKVLLVEVTGINLRNRIGHGLDEEVGQREAALLIHCACHLRLLVPGERPRGEAPQGVRDL